MQNAVEGTSGRRYLVGVYNFIAGTNALRNMSSIPYFVIYEIFLFRWTLHLYLEYLILLQKLHPCLLRIK